MGPAEGLTGGMLQPLYTSAFGHSRDVIDEFSTTSLSNIL